MASSHSAARRFQARGPHTLPSSLPPEDLKEFTRGELRLAAEVGLSYLPPPRGSSAYGALARARKALERMAHGE